MKLNYDEDRLRWPYLHVVDLGFGQEQLLVVISLPLLSLCLQLLDGFLGVGQPLPQVCDLHTRGRGGVTHILREYQNVCYFRSQSVHARLFIAVLSTSKSTA